MDIANHGNLLHRRLFDVNPGQLDKKSSKTTTVKDYEETKEGGEKRQRKSQGKQMEQAGGREKQMQGR
jgi:hypothetical protein